MTDQSLSEFTIDRFAELAAAVDDGYAPRPSILEAAGLDAITWRHLERHWMARLAAGDDRDLAVRFGTIYSRTKNSLSSAAVTAPPAPAGEGAEARGERFGATANVDETLPTGVDPSKDTNDTLPDEIAAVSPEAAPVPQATPTKGDTVSRAGAEPAAEPAAARGASRTGAVDLTLECAPDAAARGVLPFVPPAGAAAPPKEAPPGKRWAYFDTQTGEALPTPVLIDAPERLTG